MKGCKDLFLHKIFCGSKLLLKKNFSVDARYFRHKIFLWHLFCFIHKQREQKNQLIKGFKLWKEEL